jgi:hypothetical protein
VILHVFMLQIIYTTILRVNQSNNLSFHVRLFDSLTQKTVVWILHTVTIRLIDYLIIVRIDSTIKRLCRSYFPSWKVIKRSRFMQNSLKIKYILPTYNMYTVLMLQELVNYLFAKKHILWFFFNKVQIFEN